jgi:tRNA(Arg) A34 adenosine deaminase TadA
MHRALELAWESARAGSLGIGAVVTDADGAEVACGRNRLVEHHPGDDHLAGTSLAHAELNALAKLRWGGHANDRLTLWTTLEPCLQCTGAIRMAPIAEVRMLSPDPIFRNLDAMRHVGGRLGGEWPEYVPSAAGPQAVFSLLLQTHLLVLYRVDSPHWAAALPRVTELARSLVGSGELIALAADGAGLDATLAALAPRLEAAVPDVEALWAG